MKKDLHIQRYLLTGLLTVFPLWLTWIVFEFILRQLSKLGAPIVNALSSAIGKVLPSMGAVLDLEWLHFLLAVIMTVGVLYLLGWGANRVVGKQLLANLDTLMARIPLVQKIYGGTKQLLSVLQKKPEGAQRVVLIEFPHPGMRTIGFVTRVLQDSNSGRDLAAVYVPTTPNPTSGYLEIVPVEDLVPTEWTVDQAMAFIISGGAVAPTDVPFTHSTKTTVQVLEPDPASALKTAEPPSAKAKPAVG